MQLKTILNSVEKQSGFVYGEAKFVDVKGTKQLHVNLKPHARSRPVCSQCGCKGPVYDTLKQRAFEFVPMWGIPVFFLYRMRRVKCGRCGVKVEKVPWTDGKHRSTLSYRVFLARWAKRLSWKETAEIFGTSWNTVYRCVRWVVAFGVVNRDLTGLEAIGVDEIQYRRGHQYLTLVYQIDEGSRRLLHVARNRTEDSLRSFFRVTPDSIREGIRFVCSDMWRGYLNVIAEQCSTAVHVLDRFHVMQKFNQRLSEVRAAEAKQLKADGYEPVLKNSRWLLLKRPENLTEAQAVKLSDLLQYNLRSVRAYLMREDFQRFWEYRSAHWAGRFLDEWCTRAMRSRIEPMKKMAKTLRSHRQLLVNWFRAKGEFSSGCVEGMNGKAKLAMKKAYGFKSYETIETALYHQLGNLPEPKTNHKFC
ncbi:MAG: ISL3 family transposase [Azonexus sp.]